MGTTEKESAKRTRNQNLQKIILQTVATAGLLSVALLAPNALQILKEFGYEPKKRQHEIINLSRHRLIKTGLMQYKDGFLELTPEGKRKLEQLESTDYKIKIPKKWDKKWRILIFDIRESRKSLREKVRNTLRAVGFVRLQDSVWVYPYDCEDLITLLKADFKIGKELLYLIVDSIENDGWIQKSFCLKK